METYLDTREAAGANADTAAMVARRATKRNMIVRFDL
jgi:hypothetical protein